MKEEQTQSMWPELDDAFNAIDTYHEDVQETEETEDEDELGLDPDYFGDEGKE